MINEGKMLIKFPWAHRLLIRKKLFAIKERDLKNLTFEGAEIEMYHYTNGTIQPFWKREVKNFEPMIEVEYGEDEYEKFLNQRYYFYIRNDGEEITNPYSREGMYVPVKDRTGILDQKLRAIPYDTKQKWIKDCDLALKSIYASHMNDGCTVFYARKNMFLTVLEHYVEKFGELPRVDVMRKIINVIVWNINQTIYYMTIEWATNEMKPLHVIKKNIKETDGVVTKIDDGWNWKPEDYEEKDNEIIE